MHTFPRLLIYALPPIVVVLVVIAIWRSRVAEVRKAVNSEDCAIIAREGELLVSAIYKYKLEVGLWPEHFEDLGPDYTKLQQEGNWRYTWRYWGDWSLQSFRKWPHARAEYAHRDGQAAWRVDFGQVAPDFQIAQTLPSTPAIDARTLMQRSASELKRRMQREPGYFEHFQGLVSVYIRNSAFAEARPLLEEFSQRSPKHWWGPAALACIDAKSGSVEAGERRLKDVLQNNRCGGNHYLLYRFYCMTEQPEKALDEIQRTVDLKTFAPFDDGHYDGKTGLPGDLFLYDMVQCAYRAKQYRLVLKISDAWDRVVAERGYGEGSSAFRALAHLGLGEFEAASKHCRDAIDENRKRKIRPNELDSIDAAIQRKDTMFEYNAWGDHPAPLNPVLNYE